MVDTQLEYIENWLFESKANKSKKLSKHFKLPFKITLNHTVLPLVSMILNIQRKQQV